jgi:hypothetical protein
MRPRRALGKLSLFGRPIARRRSGVSRPGHDFPPLGGVVTRNGRHIGGRARLVGVGAGLIGFCGCLVIG